MPNVTFLNDAVAVLILVDELCGWLADPNGILCKDCLSAVFVGEKK